MAALLIAGVASAGGAQEIGQLEGYAPSDFEITIRIELRKLLDAPELATLRQDFLTPDRHAWLDGVTDATGVDLRTDIDRVLLIGYLGDERKDEGVALFQGAYHESNIVGFCQMNGSYETHEHAGKVLHGFWSDDEKDMRYIAFLGKDVMAIGPLSAVKLCAEAAADPARRLAGDPSYATCLGRVDPEAMVAIVSRPPQTKPRDEVGRALMSNLRGFYGTVAIARDVRVLAGFLTPDEQTAEAGREVLEGFLSLASLVDGRPALKHFASRIEADSDGPVVLGTMTTTPDEAMRFAQLVKRGGRM